ncbi:MAG: DUF4837 family protein [Bacteroidota bacterium]|nr:DUF4837 family protein [Bacteroidota bacterium]
MRYLVIIFSIIFIFSISSCNHKDSKDKKNQEKQLENIPTSIGGIYELFVVGENLTSNPELKIKISESISQIIPALPQPEQMFSLTFIDVNNFNANFRKNINVLLLSVLPKDKQMQNLIGNITTKENINFIKIKNVWSEPQKVISVSGNTEEALISELQKRKVEIFNSFDKTSKIKLRNLIYKKNEHSKFTKRLSENHNFKFLVPKNYFFVLEAFPGNRDTILEKYNLNSLAWMRSESEKSNNNIIIYSVDYDKKLLESEKEIFKLKSKVSKIVTSKNKDSYMSIDTIHYDYYFQKNKLNNLEAFELKGIWQMENDWMGGPFINYIIPDKKNNRIIFIEAFIYAAGTQKRNFVKRLEVILETFSLGS